MVFSRSTASASTAIVALSAILASVSGPLAAAQDSVVPSIVQTAAPTPAITAAPVASCAYTSDAGVPWPFCMCEATISAGFFLAQADTSTAMCGFSYNSTEYVADLPVTHFLTSTIGYIPIEPTQYAAISAAAVEAASSKAAAEAAATAANTINTLDPTIVPTAPVVVAAQASNLASAPAVPSVFASGVEGSLPSGNVELASGVSGSYQMSSASGGALNSTTGGATSNVRIGGTQQVMVGLAAALGFFAFYV